MSEEKGIEVLGPSSDVEAFPEAEGLASLGLTPEVLAAAFNQYADSLDRDGTKQPQEIISEPAGTLVVFHDMGGAQYPMGAAKFFWMSSEAHKGGEAKKGGYHRFRLQLPASDLTDFVWLVTAPTSVQVAFFPGFTKDLKELLEGPAQRALMCFGSIKAKAFDLNTNYASIEIQASSVEVRLIGFTQQTKNQEPTIVTASSTTLSTVPPIEEETEGQ